MKQVKRLLGVFLLLALVLIIAGCGKSAENGTSSQENNVNGSNQTVEESETTGSKGEQVDDQRSDADNKSSASEKTGTENGSDILVVYFSRTGEQYNVGVIDKGNTAIVAGMIAEETGADTFEILPENDTYPTTYDALTDVAIQEQKAGARPVIKGEMPNLSQYSTIFIGAPVWWGDWPMICYTYFEANDFSGKTLIPFSTHEGSGLSGFDIKLSEATSGSDVKTGLAVRGQDAQNKQSDVRDDVKEWLAGLGF